MKVLDLSTKPAIKEAKHWTAPINQLYHPTGFFGQDTQDIVYSRNNINTTKFAPLLLKEWFYLIKNKGLLVIDYHPNERVDFQKLEKIMWWLWQGEYDIIYHGEVGRSDLASLNAQKLNRIIKDMQNQQTISSDMSQRIKNLRFICRKIRSTKKKDDDINKWTFGIITKGERHDWIEEIIQAIRSQNIPNYEIIICGTYFDRKEKDVKYIPFFERDDKGWITKKKNVIARESKYENLCFLHDRIVLDKNWFHGIKKYGNCFDMLCNRQLLKGSDLRAGDWLTYGNKHLDNPYKISQLEYTDWDEFVYMSGQLSILKKSLWEKCPWNETRYWGEEDVELSYRARDMGYLIRFNQFSSATALTWRFGKLPSKYYASQSLIPTDMLLRRASRVAARVMFSIPILKNAISPIFSFLIKLKVYNYILRH